VDDELDLLQGTLDLMVMQTLSTIGPQHAYGVARRIKQVSQDKIILNRGRSMRRSYGCSSVI
jgi:hypothetical protein